MTGASLIGRLRSLARDADRGASTAARFYSTDEIVTALTKARSDCIGALFDISDLAPHRSLTEYLDVAGSAVPIQRPRITLSGLLRSVAYTASAQAVPADFWRIEYGSSITDGYVKGDVAAMAEPMQNTWEKSVYVKNGAFYGTLCTVYYWANPTTTITDDATDLNAGDTPLNDAFYNTVLFRGLAYLIAKERGDKDSRVQLALKSYTKRLASLK
jgi:hypothetical protein